MRDSIKTKLKSLRVPNWIVVITVDGKAMTFEAQSEKHPHLSQKRMLDIRTEDPEVIEAMLWATADDVRGSVPPIVGRQVMRLTVQMEEELGL